MELNNNSNEMKTVVETFIIEETQKLIYDNEHLDKWNELITDLGLEGQTKIVEPKKSPIPFMFIKQGMRNVFETLCPRKILVENYDITPIPVEILELVALSKKENYFTKIEIWYDDKDPDPVCVGVVNRFIFHKKGSYSRVGKEEFKTKQEAMKFIEANNLEDVEVYDRSWTDSKYYLLGKWADVKHSFDELKQMATKRYIAEKGNDLKKQLKEAQRGLDDLEMTAFELFN